MNIQKTPDGIVFFVTIYNTRVLNNGDFTLLLQLIATNGNNEVRKECTVRV